MRTGLCNLEGRGMRSPCAARRLSIAAIFVSSASPAVYADSASGSVRTLYAVNECSNNRGSISVYDLDAGHRLIRTIHTVPSANDVRGVADTAAHVELAAISWLGPRYADRISPPSIAMHCPLT
jgi:hypothetical protein